MAIDPRISLAGQNLNVMQAITGGYEAGEHMANRGVRDTLLDQDQQMNAQTIQHNKRQQAIEAGQYSVKLMEGLMGIPMSERAAVVAQQMPLLESMGVPYQEIVSGGLDDNSLNQRITTGRSMLFSAEKTADDRGKIGTYNPRDYTEESFSQFVQGDMSDPSVLERYFPLNETKIGGTTYFSDASGQLYLPVAPNNPSEPATPEQIESGEAVPSPAPVPLTPEAQRQQQVDTETALTIARAEATQDVQQQDPEKIEQRRKATEATRTTINTLDQMINSDRLDNITGVVGNLPTLRPATRDMLNTATQLASLFTAENLGIMSGVLSESDIGIIRGLSQDLGFEFNEDQNVTGFSGSYEGTVRKMKNLRAKTVEALNSKGVYLDGQTATGPNGLKITSRNGAWYDSNGNLVEMP